MVTDGWRIPSGDDSVDGRTEDDHERTRRGRRYGNYDMA